MSAIEQIKEKLRDYPDLKYWIGPDRITIESLCPDGFSVALIEGDREWIVSFGGWHGHFDSEKQALNCFAFGLSNQCRLEVTSRGNFAYRWTVQKNTENGWEPYSTVGLMLFPFWRTKRIAYRQNSILKGDYSCRG